jgi:putative membrane protein
LAEGAGDLAAGGDKLAGGADDLTRGIAKLDNGAKELADGASGLSNGARQLAGGLDQLADGTDQLADGLKPLAAGIRSSADGASQLATGASQLSSGTQDLATGIGQSATGAEQLSDGLTKLSDGGVKLSDGSRKLADGLTKGAEQVPSYDQSTRTKLAEVVATPVTTERPTSLFADIANTTFLAAIALWLGGLASFIVLRAVPSSVLTSMKASWRLAAEALLPAAGVAAVQAVALTAVLQVLLELNFGQVAQLLPFLLLAGIAFAAVNQALVAWLGGVGRFISVALVVLAAAAAITSATPALLDLVTPFLPVTPALEGSRAIVSDGTGVLGTVGLLLAWLVVGATAAVLAVARRRMLPAAAPVAAT